MVTALVVGRAFVAPTRSVPSLTVVAPECVLAPESVNVPLPTLTSEPLPPIVPAKVVLLLSAPVDSVAPPSVTVPAPASEPMVWSKPLRSTVAPAAMVTALAAGKASAAPACSVPTLTMVAPE